MDESLPLGSLSPATLQTLLEKERGSGAELEQELSRLQAGLIPQNEIILGLERRESERQQQMRQVSAGTRSSTGSTTRMMLSSICATAPIQGKDPSVVCQQILLAQSDTPSPLATTSAA